MEYSTLNEVPDDCELVYMISDNEGKFHKFLAGNFYDTNKYICKTYNNSHNVDEVIRKHKPCKPYFDIDYVLLRNEDAKARNIFDAVIDSIVEASRIFSVAKLPLKATRVYEDIIIGDATRFINNGINIKMSYHIIIKNIMLTSSVEASKFCDLVISCFAGRYPDYTPCFDKQVYRANHCFRTMMSVKNGDKNSSFKAVKKYMNWQQNYQQTLVTLDHERLLDPSKSLPVFSFMDIFGDDEIVDEAVATPKQVTHKLLNISVAEVYDALLRAKLKQFSFDIMTPRYDYFEGNGRIHLKRINPRDSIKCPLPLCQREHENENMYLNVVRSNGLSFLITAHCYRHMEMLYNANNTNSPVLPANMEEDKDEDKVPKSLDFYIIGYYNIITKCIEKSAASIDYFIDAIDPEEVIPKVSDQDIQSIKMRWRYLMKKRMQIIEDIKNNETFSDIIEKNDDVFDPFIVKRTNIRTIENVTNEEADLRMKKLMNEFVNKYGDDIHNISEVTLIYEFDKYLQSFKEDQLSAKELMREANVTEQLLSRTKYSTVEYDMDVSSATFENLHELFNEDKVENEFEIKYINEPIMPSFLVDPANKDVSMFYVSSETGTGKSRAIEEYVKANPNASVCITVPRITLAFKYWFELSQYGFQTHVHKSNTLSANLDKCDRVIVVLNSLWAIEIRKKYDLFVIDELIAMYSQLTSIGNRLNTCVATLETVLKTAVRVVILEAHLTYRAIEPFLDMTFLKKYNQQLLINNYNRGAAHNHVWHIVKSDRDFILILLRLLKEDKRFAICCTSKTMVDSLELFIKLYAPEKRVCTITGETPKKTKAFYIEHLDELLLDKVCVIYNTVVTVGVSSTIEDVDAVLAYSNNNCVLPETHIQQSFRLRTCKTIYIRMGVLPNIMRPETIESLMSYICTYLDASNREISTPYRFDFELKQKVFLKCAAFKMLFTNQLIINQSCKAPDERMLTLIRMTGAKIVKVPPQENIPEFEIDKDFKMSDIRKILKAERMLDVAAAFNSLTEDDNLYETSRKLIENHKYETTINRELFAKLQALRMKHIYSFEGEVDTNIVHKYLFTESTINIYKTSKMFFSCSSYNEFLAVQLQDAFLKNTIATIIKFEDQVMHRHSTYAHSVLLVESLNELDIYNPLECKNKLCDVCTPEIDMIVKKAQDLLPIKKSNERAKVTHNTLTLNRILNPYGMLLKSNKTNNFKTFTLNPKFNYITDKDFINIDKPHIVCNLT